VIGPHGETVQLDLRHLGEARLRERLPQIYELALNYLGVDPARETIPVVFGKMAGERAAARSHEVAQAEEAALQAMAGQAAHEALAWLAPKPGTKPRERLAMLRREMAQSLEDGCGIYRTGEGMQRTCDKLAELKERLALVQLDDSSRGWNTEWLLALELGYQLEAAEAMAHSALARRESRGSHQRLDGYAERDDENFLAHTLAWRTGPAAPRITHAPVRITRSAPGRRVYGAALAQEEAQEEAQKNAQGATHA
jgi:fumarate reductase flavoprotein subunit